jgi:hypothetical protein
MPLWLSAAAGLSDEKTRTGNQPERVKELN